jgi:hypothetical protein
MRPSHRFHLLNINVLKLIYVISPPISIKIGVYRLGSVHGRK